MPDSSVTNDPLETLAHQLVDEAIALLPEPLAPHEEARLRSRMLCDLLADPEGRLRLRRCLEDPAVDSSDERQRQGARSDDDEERSAS